MERFVKMAVGLRAQTVHCSACDSSPDDNVVKPHNVVDADTSLAQNTGTIQFLRTAYFAFPPGEADRKTVMRFKLNALHRSILIRLVPAWFALSVVFGGIAFWLESRQVNQFVYTLASDAVEHFSVSTGEAFFALPPGAQRQRLSTLLQNNQFVGGVVFSRNKVPLVESWLETDTELVTKVRSAPHEFPSAGHHHETERIGGQYYVLALAPLLGKDQSVQGYFEGVYRVPRVTAQAIENRVRDTLLGVVLVLSVASVLFYSIILQLHHKAFRLSQDLLVSNLDLMRVLGSAIAKRDSDTDSHNYRVTLYAVSLAETLGRPTKEIAALIAGAFLHDIGKIGISDLILLKPGKLSDEEFSVMKQHVMLGEDILHKARWLGNAREVVVSHHERYDGSGYPKGLKGEAIPFNARLFAIVDVFDALTSARPYKEALSCDDSLDILVRSGHQFDPAILNAFVAIAPALHRSLSQADSQTLDDRLSRVIGQYFQTDSD